MFVVLVDLSVGAMFLHRVDVNKHYPATKKGSVRVDFDLQNDRFCEDSARVIANAAAEVALSHVRKLLADVQTRTKEIRKTILAHDEGPDPLAIIELMRDRYTFKEELAQACALADALRVGSSEYLAAKKDLESALQELRDYMEQWDMHVTWDDHGDIIRFIQEGR